METKEKNFISLVLYVHNAGDVIQKFLNMATEALDKRFEKYEIICVNDASTDGANQIIAKFATECKGVVSIINMSYKQGIEAAMNAGVDLAIGDFVFEIDSPFIDYSPELFLEVYERSLSGFDIVAASPERGGRKTSKLFYCIYNWVSNTQNKLRTESFRILSRRAINRIQSISKSIPYRKPIYANCGLKMDCISYKSVAVVSGAQISKYTNRQSMAINSLVLFTDIAYRLSVCFALIMMIGAAGISLYVAGVYMSNAKPVEGWTTTMLFLSFCFSATFGLFAAVIKYLSIILDMIFKQQNYLIDSIEKFGK